MASCVRNIPTKDYQNLETGFQVPVENVVDAFFWNTVNTEASASIVMCTRAVACAGMLFAVIHN